MAKHSPEKAANFLVHYFTLPAEERKRIRDAFIERTAISVFTWYSKLRRRNYNPLEIEELERICGVESF